MQHTPVLLREVLGVLRPSEGESVLDCTLGLGGHASEFLRRIGSEGSFVGIDADVKNLLQAKQRFSHPSVGHTRRMPDGRDISFVHANFRELPQCLPSHLRTFDVIFADLGLSSPHLDDPKRGFSIRGDGPLDMRFDQSNGMTAAMKLAATDERTLAKWFSVYGELPQARRLAREIVEFRSQEQIQTSDDLRAIAEHVYGYKTKDCLAQIFQALRIAVNDELGSLEKLLGSTPSLLTPGGRLGIVCYHSLEDRLVKTRLRELATPEKDQLTGAKRFDADFVLLTKRAIQSSEDEVRRNPRSRSARFRALAKQTVYTSHRS